MTIWDQFDHKRGSRRGSSVWPSDDPKDSPYDEYICKRCGKKLSLQMYGSQFIGDPSFDDQALDQLQTHLMSHCSDSFLQNLNTNNRIALGILILRDLEKEKKNVS
jgi:hypothetical protein